MSAMTESTEKSAADEPRSDPAMLDLVRALGMGALAEAMGIEIIAASAERLVGTMPVDGNTQPFGLLHGGASVVLAESLGSIGGAIHGTAISAGELVAVGVDINATHHLAVRSGTVTGVATAVHLGRRMVTYDIVITDDDGHRVCTSRITCAMVPAGRQPSAARS
jgi:1,4-dihydroxy-2-naphthoyl-CoA hydrolase